MKKRLEKKGSLCCSAVLALGILMLAGLFLVPGQGLAAGKAYKITIVGGSAGGVWSVMTEGVAESIRRALPDARITTEPGKDGPNQIMVAKNEIEIAVTNEGTSYAAVNGLDPYKSKLPNIRTLIVLNPTSPFQFFIDEKTGIKSFQEIKDRKFPLKVGLNRKGTLMELAGKVVMEAYGITYKDIEKWGGKLQFVASAQAVDLWDAGQLDGTSEVMQFPASRYIEHGLKHKLRMLPVTEDKIPGICKALGMTPFTIPANAYSYQKEAYRTVNTKLTLITSAEQPEEMIYELVKALYANLDYLHKVHANLRDLTPQIMAGDVLIDLHPGAKKFFREIGVIK
ncbi:MAG: TAXI family TRAP transporter solute-binding subunit [Pseudomonadota bacterium]